MARDRDQAFLGIKISDIAKESYFASTAAYMKMVDISQKSLTLVIAIKVIRHLTNILLVESDTFLVTIITDQLIQRNNT